MCVGNCFVFTSPRHVNRMRSSSRLKAFGEMCVRVCQHSHLLHSTNNLLLLLCGQQMSLSSLSEPRLLCFMKTTELVLLGTEEEFSLG